jgi:chromosome partitioning protein
LDLPWLVVRTEVMDLAGRYHDILIDAGGRDSVELRAALVVSEHAFIPIQASQFDVWTLSRVNELVKAARGFNSGLRAFIDRSGHLRPTIVCTRKP